MPSQIIWVVKILVAFSGMTLPGYFTARLLGVRNAWTCAFPFSALLIVQVVITLSIIHIPLRFLTVAVVLGFWTLLTFIWCNLRQKSQSPAQSLDDKGEPGIPQVIRFTCIGFASVVVLAVLYRTTMYPLSGYDTYFRWEALARQILQFESLSHYPPVSAADFSIYLIPDGIPPLVASIYWWFYAAIGKPVTQITSIPVTLQLISAMALVYYSAMNFYGSRSANFSLWAFSSSSLLVTGFAMGQETGFTAVSVVGQIFCAWSAVQKPSKAAVVSVALFASLGALSRDYGPALALTGFLILAWQPATRRYLLLFVVSVVMLSAPWYLRNLVLTGNPLYPHALLGVFQGNQIFAGIQNSYHRIFAFNQYDVWQWMSHFGLLLFGAPLVIIGCLPFGVIRWQKSGPLIIMALIITVLWLCSMGETAGGVAYSMRVMTPVFAVLSLLTGINGAHLYCRFSGRIRSVVLIVSVLLSGYSVAVSLSHPFSPEYFSSAVTYKYSGFPEICPDTEELTQRLKMTNLPSTGVLTSNAYLATILQRETRFRPVMVWSPEVNFAFDRSLSALEVKRRLIEKNVRIVALERESINNYFLMKFAFFDSFFRTPQNGGCELLAVVGNEGFCYLADTE